MILSRDVPLVQVPPRVTEGPANDRPTKEHPHHFEMDLLE